MAFLPYKHAKEGAVSKLKLTIILSFRTHVQNLLIAEKCIKSFTFNTVDITFWQSLPILIQPLFLF